MNFVVKESVVFVEPQDRKDGHLLPVSSSLQEGCRGKVMASAHIHTTIEILYVTEGQFTASLSGVEYVIEEGDMLLVHSREIHSVVATGEGKNQYYCLKIDPNLLYSSRGEVMEAKYILPFTVGNAENQRLFKAESLEKTGVPKIIPKLHRENQSENYGRELAVKAETINLLLFILRYWNDHDIDLHLDMSDYMLASFYKVFNYINSHFSEEISAMDCSRMANISYSYFSRVFKRLTGQNFNDYLNTARLNEAEKQLISTDKSITEIAFDCGFSDSCYFIARFKKRKGITPKQFRNEYRIKA